MLSSMLFIYLSYLFIILMFIAFTIYKRFEYQKEIHTVLNFHNLINILEYNMKKAFQIVYKENVFIYSLEASKITPDQFNVLSKEFGKLTLKLCGTTIKRNLISLYGDEETLLFNIIEYFNSNIENDEIYKATSNQLMQEDINI